MLSAVWGVLCACYFLLPAFQTYGSLAWRTRDFWFCFALAMVVSQLPAALDAALH